MNRSHFCVALNVAHIAQVEKNTVLRSVVVIQTQVDARLGIRQFLLSSVQTIGVAVAAIATQFTQNNCLSMHKLTLPGIGLLISLSLISCHIEDQNNQLTFGQLYVDKLTGQEIKERNFLEVSYEKLYTIPHTEDIFLYRPEPALIDSQGNAYIIDRGIHKIHKFSPSGRYILSYGETGGGEGPGELQNITDFGITSDSIVHVVDSYGRKIVYFSNDGSFLHERREKHQPSEYKKTLMGREYIAFFSGPNLIETRLDGNLGIIFSKNLLNQENLGLMGLGGYMDTYNENVVYLFGQYPLLQQYKPDGSLIYSRTTIGYNDEVFKEPEIETLMLDGMPARRNVGRYFHVGPITIDDGRLFMLGISPREAPNRTAVIDVYDVSSGDYQNSIFVPEEGIFKAALYQNERIYVSKDSTVMVWKVHS